MKANSLKVLLYSSLLAVSVGSQQTLAQTYQAHQGESPTAVVQAFLNTMDYQYLSDQDKAVWDEQTWNQIQASAVQANQARLPAGHELYELETFVRQFVAIEAVSHEYAKDGSAQVTAETAYPELLILIDDYIDTKNSSAHEQLMRYQARFESGELSADNIELFESEMAWRVNGGGVYVNAAQMQENMQELHAQSGW